MNRRRNRKTKRHQKSRSRKQAKRSVKYNRYRKAQNIIIYSRSKGEKEVFNEASKGPHYFPVKAPENFSLSENPIGVIKFINNLKSHFEKRKSTLVNVKNVKNIGHDAIVLLLSIVIRFKSKKIQFNGNFPDNEEVRAKLVDSGFFKALFNKSFKPQDEYNLYADSEYNLITTHAQKNVDQVQTAKLIEGISENIWGSKRDCKGVQKTLIELMTNTNNHASIEQRGDKHWWLSVNYDRKEEKIVFSFVDYGVGIFKSLLSKPDDHPFKPVINKLFATFGYSNNDKVLKKIFEGELRTSSTGLENRGYGLNGIGQSLRKNDFTNLTIVSNDVVAKLADDAFNDEFNKIPVSFSGTFVSWELNIGNNNFEIYE